MANVRVNNLTGLNGGEVITARAVTGKNYSAIYCVTPVTLNTIVSNLDQGTSNLNGAVLVAGATIFGITTAIDVNAGTVIAYDA
jgi:hypothetical protein